MNLFQKLNVIDYQFGAEWQQVRNVFIKLRLLDSLKGNPQFLTTYTLHAEERADVVAHKLYGDSELFWTLYLVNDIIDPTDWIMPATMLDSYVKEKYDNPYGSIVAEDTTTAEDWFLKRKPFGTVDSNPQDRRTQKHATTPYAVEEAANDAKRIIRAIRPEFMQAFLKDAEDKLRGYRGNRK